MKSSENNSSSARPSAANFALTRWSVVLSAGSSDSTHAREALESLCRAYWHPIYAFVRREGHNPSDAQDLTQEFFARLLAKNYLGAVDRAKGRFRSFLLASLKHFLANEWDKTMARKRGGRQAHIPINIQSAESSYGLEPADSMTAERIFERRWALTLLAQVLAALRAEYAARGKTELFEELKATLTGERHTLPYSKIGARLQLSENAVKVAVHRVRRRYRELLRSEIAQTVSGPEEVEAEIRALFSALAS